MFKQGESEKKNRINKLIQIIFEKIRLILGEGSGLGF